MVPDARDPLLHPWGEIGQVLVPLVGATILQASFGAPELAHQAAEADPGDAARHGADAAVPA